MWRKLDRYNSVGAVVKAKLQWIVLKRECLVLDQSLRWGEVDLFGLISVLRRNRSMSSICGENEFLVDVVRVPG